MNLNRLALLLYRRLAARRLDVPFSRASAFAMPQTIRINNAQISLRVPAESGVRTAFIELLLDDCYSLRRLRRERIARVLDIGGNVGLFGLAARQAFPEAIIHSYEPNRSLKPYLAHQAKAAGFKFFLEAVGGEEGQVRLDIDEKESVHTTSHIELSGDIPQIELRTAIERIGGQADLVKMDCEGAEWEMLKNPDSWKGVRFLSLEYHLRPGLDHKSIGTALDRCGFRIVDQRRADTFGLVFAKR